MTGHQLVRKFILFTDADVVRFMAFMQANRRPMAEQERYLQVVVSEYKKNRSTEANAYMWAGLLTPISEQAFVGGQQFKPEVWGEFFKELFLPPTNAKGMEKYMYLPNGTRKLMMGSSDLNVDEMRIYCDQIAAYAATELGVLLPQNPRDV